MNNLARQIKKLQEETDYKTYRNYYTSMYNNYKSKPEIKNNIDDDTKAAKEAAKAEAAAETAYTSEVLKEIFHRFSGTIKELTDKVNNDALDDKVKDAAAEKIKNTLINANNFLKRKNYWFERAHPTFWETISKKGGVILTDLSVDDFLSNTSLTEEIKLTEAEDNLIFGNFLEKNLERSELEEASKISIGNVNQAMKNAGNKNLTPEMKNQAKMFAKKAISDKIKQDHAARTTTSQDKHLDDGKGISEAANPAIAATIQKQITAKQNNLDRKVDAEKAHDIQFQKEKDSIKKQIDAAETRKDKVEGKNDIVTEAARDTTTRISPDLRSEKRLYIDKRLDPAHRGDNLDLQAKTKETKSREDSTVAKYSAMLYNGISGDALKYFINGDITNGNSEDITVAKTMINDPEVKIVLKKINFYLRKATRNQLTYKDYIDLKVQKSQFRQLFTKAKNKYSNRYK